MFTANDARYNVLLALNEHKKVDGLIQEIKNQSKKGKLMIYAGYDFAANEPIWSGNFVGCANWRAIQSYMRGLGFNMEVWHATENVHTLISWA